MLEIPEELSHSQGRLNLSYFESSKRMHKGQHQTHLKFGGGEHPFKVTT